MAGAPRFCPLCAATTEERICPADGAPTVKLDIFEEGEAEDLVGKTLAGRYEVGRLLGIGGMGCVYEGHQLSVGRPVAIKTLTTKAFQNRTGFQRFYNEAHAASRLTSPHFVQIIDFGIDEELRTPFIVMELLVGRTLYQELRRHGPFSVHRAASIAAPIARALVEAAAVGVVHRDLKPANIFLVQAPGGGDFVKITDFGIARDMSAQAIERGRLTETGMTLGTPHYMSPEQIAGAAAIDVRADLYSLGCMIYELVVGHPPFPFDEHVAVLLAHVRHAPPELPRILPSGERRPARLNELVLRLLAKATDERLGDPAEVLAVLDGVATESLIRGSPAAPRRGRGSPCTDDEPPTIAFAREGEDATTALLHVATPKAPLPTREEEVAPTLLVSTLRDGDDEEPPTLALDAPVADEDDSGVC